MSKLNEIIVLQIPDKGDPCTAYLLDNGDGTHDRYVSDENGNISKQESGIKTVQPGVNIIIDNTDPKNPIISSISPSATITNSDINNWNKQSDWNQTDNTSIDFIKNKPDLFSGGSGIIEVTYDKLVNLKNTSSLVKGQNYLLTDYMTTYEQPVTGLMKSSGVTEPLIITATDVNKLHNQCKSTLYPQDIIFYEITGDIGNYYGTEGFTKGKIYRRIDTLRNNDIGTDWRHVKYDRDGVDKLLFEDYTGVYNNKIETYNLFNSVIGNGFNGNTIGNNFQSNTIGDNFQSNTIGNYFYSNTIGDNFQSNTIGNYFYSNTIGNYFYSNTIGDNFQSNTIGNYFQSNTIGNYFQSNTIGDNFQSNTIGDGFYSNTIGNYFYSNTIGDGFQSNTIGDNFQSNTIGNYFYSNTIGDNFQSNTIGNYFQSNTIGNYFYSNTIGDNFQSNTIGDNFQSNTIGDGFQSNGNQTTPFLSQNTEFRNDIVSVTSTTEIQNQYLDVVVFKSPNGALKQRYYDDSNTLVINNL